MATLNRFIRNIANQSAASAVVGVVTFGLQILLARKLGPAAFGVYGIAASIAGIVFILQDGGFRTLLYRETTHPTRSLPAYQAIFSYALGWNILASGCLATLALAGASLLGAITAGAVAILIATNLARVVSLDISSLLRAEGLFASEARWQITNRTSIALVMIIAIALSDNLILILAVGAVVQFCNLLLPLPRRLLRSPKFELNHDLLRVCATLVTIDMVTALYFRSDVLIMAAFGHSKEEIGVYAALTRIIEAYIFVVAPAAVIFFRSARLGARDGRRPAKTLWRLIAAIAVPTLVLLAFTVQYHDWIIGLIFGRQFSSGSPYLAWLIAACCAAAPNALLGQALLAYNRDKYFLAAVIGALAVNLPMNLVLIPISGAMGAAQATFATEFSLMLFLTAALYAPMKGATATGSK
jgi:O-antigen/teichoic acid export membrane protein